MRNLIKENLTHLQSNYTEWTKLPDGEGFDIDGFIEDVFLTENKLMVDGERCRMNCIDGDLTYNMKGMDNETIFDVVCCSVDHYVNGMWCFEDFKDWDDDMDDDTGEEMLEEEQDILYDRLQEFII